MDFFARQFLAAAKHLKQDLAALRASVDALRDQNERNHNALQAQLDSLQPPIKVEAETHEREADANDKRSREDRNRRVQRWVAIGTVGATLATAVYAIVTYYTLRELRKQTPSFQTAASTASEQFKLTVQQLEYTQGANVKLIASLGFAQVGDPLYLRLTNIGHETASKTCLSLDVRKRRTGSEQVEGNTEHFTVTPRYDLVAIQEASIGTEDNHTDMPQRPLHITAKEESEFREANLFLEATGTLEYFNGFHTVSVPICLRNISFAPDDIHHNSPGGDLVQCGENFEALKEIVLRAKRVYTPPR